MNVGNDRTLTPDRLPKERGLSPTREHPLSLWNARDYLRLLKWVWYRPQDLRWYGERFCGDGDADPSDRSTLQQPDLGNRRRLACQGAIVAVGSACAICTLLDRLGVPISWWAAVVSFLLQGLVCLFPSRDRIAGRILWAVISAPLIALVGVAFGVGWRQLVRDPIAGIEFCAALGLVSGISGGLSAAVDRKPITIDSILNSGKMPAICLAVIAGLAIGADRLTGSDQGNAILMICVGLALGLASSCLGILRLEDWLLGLIFGVGESGRATPIPLPGLTTRLKRTLQDNWEVGVLESLQYLEYTHQFESVAKAVEAALNTTPDHDLVARTRYLTETMCEWYTKRPPAETGDSDLTLYPAVVSAGGWRALPVHENYKSRGAVLFYRYNYYGSTTVSHDFATWLWHLNRHRALLTGFWHLYRHEALDAVPYFHRARRLRGGAELLRLAKALSECGDVETVTDFESLEIGRPPNASLDRPAIWEAIECLRSAADAARVALGSERPEERHSTLSKAIDCLRNERLARLDGRESGLSWGEVMIFSRLCDRWMSAMSSSANGATA